MSAGVSNEIKNFIAKTIGSPEYECMQLAGDASNRRYYRIVFAGQSHVLMIWEPFKDTESYPFLNVQSHFAKVDVRVPKVEAVAPDLGVVLLEDLGDLTLERKFWENQNQELALPYYAQAIDELIKIHFLASQDDGRPSVCQQIQFDTAKFMWEMNYAREHFLEKVGGVKLSEADQKRLQDEFVRLCETLDKQPKFVCHRDYHSRNLMLKLNRVYVIDFQDARLGPLQYDLVSLVHDSYVNLSAESIDWIKKDYVNKARALGRKGSLQPDFEDIFRLQVIQRCFKACGSFTSFFNARNDTRYLKYVKHTAFLVADTLRDQGGFPLFTDLLWNSGLLERDYTELCAP
ncbi:MAG: phosphotransferase [Calothrix sp. SM1_5_4]|nr:phosphotransferase [Calothrix sp. SM1_5_4]